MRIFLIGFMGSGKTTVGKKMAKKYSVDFIDLDDYLVNKQQSSIREIINKKGEDGFRELEMEILHEVVQNYNDVIVSTGGGAPCYYDNMDFMNSNGVTIYLKGESGMLTNRILNSKDDRPLVKSKNPIEVKQFVEELLSNREPFYSKATLIVDALNVRIDELIEEIRSNNLS